MPRTPPSQRRNGFSRPHAPLQMATWVALPFLVVCFLLFCSPVLPLAASIPVTLVYAAAAASATYFAYLACVTDPMDLHLALELHRTQSNNGNDAAFAEALDTSTLPPNPPSTFWYKPPDFRKLTAPCEQEGELLKYCWVCETSVAEHSMHCKYCNKCVSHFDHHCQWLNTCIGDANYQSFYYALWGLCSMLLLQLSVLLGLIVDYFVDGSTLERAQEWLGEDDAATALAAIWIFVAIFVAIALFLMGQLLWFHIQLRRENLSTYHYIVRESQRKRDAAKLEKVRAKERSRAVQAARMEKQEWYAMRLDLGKHCACCDPLPPTVLDQDEDGNGEHGEAPYARSNGNSNNVPNSSPSSSSEGKEDSDDDNVRPKTTSSSYFSEMGGERASTSSNGAVDHQSPGETKADEIDEAHESESPQPILWQKV